MKKTAFVLAIGFFLVMVGPAMAAPKFVDAIPTCDQSGNVIIPPLPSGASLLNVVVYDDVNGVPGKSLGNVQSFSLLPGQGFNFTWRDATGTWWQMVTPSTRAPGLTTDCSNPNGCKFLYEK
ncbi:MAG: hypothetical protein PHQ20_01865 [Candidatus Moranbacteria bacterium]|jgi:hypothetical protein|nr:hypothetical protein [Candidatus Moranbacteria bacterium]